MTHLLDPRTAAESTVRRSWAASLRGLRARPWGDPLLVGLVALVVTVAFTWVPSIWYDESATIVSAQRSWTELWAEIHHVDAVHATYYAFMHVWFAVFGYTPFSLRFPSALATALAAGLVVVLARELTTRRTAVVAGLVFLWLPRVTWMGGEGRSYATTALLATAVTLVFVHAVRHSLRGLDGWSAARARRWWLLYGVLAFASTAVFLYSALIIVGHGLTLALWALRSRRVAARPAASPIRGGPQWRTGLGWIVSAGISGGLLIPLAHLSSSESGQVGWLAKPDLSTVLTFATWQWFMEAWWFAILGWALVVAGVVALVRHRARSTRFTADVALDAASPTSDAPDGLQVLLPWMLLPALVLIAVSCVGHPLYSPRYVTFSAPAVAILMAIGLTAFRSRRLVATGLALVVAVSLPTYVNQRLPETKDDSSWSEVAALVARERSLEEPRATDAIVYGAIRSHAAGSARNIAYSYPAAFRGMTDVTLRTPAAQTGELWETRYPLAQTIDRVDGHEYVWVVESDTQGLRATVGAALAPRGYHLENEWHETWVTVLRYRL